MVKALLRAPFRIQLIKRFASSFSDRVVIPERISLSHANLVEATLSSHIPSIEWPSNLSEGNSLPIGSFLCFFNHAVAESELNSDGYDDLQAPQWDSDYIVLRRWTGGRIEFNADRMLKIGDDAICEETTQMHSMKTTSVSKPRRRCAVIIDRKMTVGPVPCIREYRTLQYFEATSSMLQRLAKVAMGKRFDDSKLIARPTFAHSMRLTETLLFRYSALCFNAHKIHINSNYARQVEGLSDAVVQGPLLVTLALRWFSSLIKPGTRIHSFSYENLGSSMVGETISFYASQTDANQWSLLITRNPDGSSQRLVFDSSIELLS